MSDDSSDIRRSMLPPCEFDKITLGVKVAERAKKECTDKALIPAGRTPSHWCWQSCVDALQATNGLISCGRA